MTAGLDTVTRTRALPSGTSSPRAVYLLRRVAAEAPIVCLCAALAAVALLDLPHDLQADSWLTLVGGREIVSHGIPYHDALAVASHGREWVDQQWLAQLLFYGLYVAGGVGAVVRANVVLFVLSLGAAAALARRRGASPSRVVVFGLPAALFAWSFVRAQVPAQLLFVLLLGLILHESRRPTYRIVFAVPLLVLWANVHGSVLVGAALVVLLGLVEAGRLTRRPSRLGALRVCGLLLGPPACVLATPYGGRVLDYYAATVGNRTLARYVTEWRSPTPTSLGGAVLLALLASAAALVWLRRRDLNAFELGALLLTGAAACVAVRSIVWFAYVAAVLLPALLERVAPKRAGREPSKVVVSGAIVLAAIAAVLFVRPGGTTDEVWPPAASRAVAAGLAASPAGRVFAAPEYADWLLFRVPRARGRVAFDGRWELLGATEMTRTITTLYRGTGARASSARYSLFVLHRVRNRRLIETLAGLGYRNLFRGADVVVIARRPA